MFGEISKGKWILHLFERSMAFSGLGFTIYAKVLIQLQAIFLFSMFVDASNTMFLAPLQQKARGVSTIPVRYVRHGVRCAVTALQSNMALESESDDETRRRRSIRVVATVFIVITIKKKLIVDSFENVVLFCLCLLLYIILKERK